MLRDCFIGTPDPTTPIACKSASKHTLVSEHGVSDGSTPRILFVVHPVTNEILIPQLLEIAIQVRLIEAAASML